jgi:hypothetical protein
VYVNTGFMKPTLIAIELGGRGVLADTSVAWRTSKNVPSMSSPVLAGERLFLVDDGGIASCIDATSGEWRERLGDGEYCASPIRAQDRVYYFDREGAAFVVRASGRFEVLARNELDAGCMASPIAVGDALLVRTQTQLYRIED